MSASLPIGWLGRLSALLLLFCVLAAMYMLGAAPLQRLYADREAAVANRRALAVKLHAVATQVPALEEQAAALRGAADRSTLTLQGGSDAIASASLQSNIEQYAAAAGVAIGSTEILPALAQGDYRRLGLRLVVNGPYEGLATLLSEVEASTPPIVIADLQIRALQGRLGSRSNNALDANLEVYAFRISDPSLVIRP